MKTRTKYTFCLESAYWFFQSEFNKCLSTRWTKAFSDVIWERAFPRPSNAFKWYWVRPLHFFAIFSYCTHSLNLSKNHIWAADTNLPSRKYQIVIVNPYTWKLSSICFIVSFLILVAEILFQIIYRIAIYFVIKYCVPASNPAYFFSSMNEWRLTDWN